VQAWQLDDTLPEPALVLAEIPPPIPGPGDVLIRVHAAGVTPTELSWYPTTHTPKGEKRRRAVPGHEFSGTVSALGSDVRGITLGQEVFGMNDWFTDGATAEYCLTQPEKIAPKPAELTHVQAASLPIGALTAWQGLLVRAKLAGGQRVLIHGGSGAVGVLAIQLAVWRGAQVVTTASDRHAEFLLGLGATQVIDYHRQKFEKLVSGLDVIFDTVGGETLARSWGLLKPGGQMVTIAADAEAGGDEGKDERTKAAFFIVEPNRKQLEEIAGLVQSGQIKPVTDSVLPLADAGKAYGGSVIGRAGRGRMVVTVHG
jgi:NADPH:quinone reductase-like Zn-dependent oxidoreductase